VVGAVLILISLPVVGGGGMALWVDLDKRDAAGYITTDVREFSTAGSALTTRPTDLGPAGFAWLYAPALLDEVRIRVSPASSDTELFVGVGPSADVDRYLEGVRHTLISDFWEPRTQTVAGGTGVPAPETQSFWVAADSGPGPRSVVWEPTNGSWTVVVMNVDGRPGIDVVATDLGATMPAAVWIALGVLAAGGVLSFGGVLLVVGAIRRRGVRTPMG
jgi:hypothetical protein